MIRFILNWLHKYLVAKQLKKAIRVPTDKEAQASIRLAGKIVPHMRKGA